MGWASFLEDIEEKRDQLRLQLQRVRTLTQDSASSPAETHRMAQSLLNLCEQLLASVEEIADMATDPDFELAYEVTMLDKEKAELQRVVDAMKVERRALEEEKVQLNEQRSQLTIQLKDLNRQTTKLEREHEDLIKRNLAVAIDKYSSPEAQRKGKPNA